MICFEGIDGSGKKTQAQILVKRLQNVGKKVNFIAYPDYSSAYGKILDSFLHGDAKLDVDQLFLVYLSDMVKDRERILKMVEEGEYVVIDRYFLSTVAYQSAGGFDYSAAKAIETLMRLPSPNVIVYLDIEPKISMSRKMKEKGNADKFESNAAYLNRVRSYYNKMIKERYAGSWVKINGDRDQEAIADEVIKSIDSIIGI